MKKVNCEKCNREISKSNYKKHLNSCDGILKTRFKKLTHCPYCNKDLTNIHGGNHTRWCKLNPNPDFIFQGFFRKNLEKTRNNITEKSRKKQGESLSRGHKEGKVKVNFPGYRGKSHSEKTKQQISFKRKQYLLENPDKHPWKKDTKFISEPCEYLKTKLKENGIAFIEEFQPLLPNRFFSIDIALADLKIGIEVNGNQHYNKDKTLKTYYQNRHDLIENAGWKLYEIHYSLVYNHDIMLNILNTAKISATGRMDIASVS